MKSCMKQNLKETQMGFTALHMTKLHRWADSQESFIAQLTAEERKVFEVTSFSTFYFTPLLNSQ